MRLGRLLILVAVVLILGLVALLFIVNSFGGDGTTGGATPPPENAGMVVILTQPVTRGERIPIEKLTTITLPRESVFETMLTDVGQAVGRVARFDLEQGTILTRTMVLDDLSQLSAEIGSDHAMQIPPGMVAIPVPISRFSSVAYGIAQGDRVNVIASMLFVDLDTQFQTLTPNNTSAVLAPGPDLIFTVESEPGESASSTFVGDLTGIQTLTAQAITGGRVTPQGRAELDSVLNQPFYLVPSEPTQRPRLVSQMVLQNVVILHVGTFPYGDEDAQIVQPQPTAQPGQTAPTPTVEPTAAPDLVTLIVTPQDAVTLNYLIFSGARLTLALRPTGDSTQVFTDAVTLDYLLDVYRIPVPARLPYGTDPRLDFLIDPLLLEELRIKDLQNTQP